MVLEIKNLLNLASDIYKKKGYFMLLNKYIEN